MCAEELLSEAFKDQCTSDGIGASLSIASKVGRVVVTEEEFLQRQQPNADREDVTWFYKVDNRGCSLFDYSAAGFVEVQETGAEFLFQKENTLASRSMPV